MAYGRLSTEFYDLDKPHAPADELALYMDQVERSNGPILEPMCGSGRFLLPIARKGVEIHGFDSSSEMITRLVGHLRQEGIQTRVSHATIDSFETDGGYGMIMVPCESLSLLTEPGEFERAVSLLNAWLLPDGILMASVERVTSHESSSWPWGGRWIEHPEGGKILLSWLGGYRHEEQVSRSLLRYERIIEGRVVETEVEEFSLRFFTEEQITIALLQAGFCQPEFLPHGGPEIRFRAKKD